MVNKYNFTHKNLSSIVVEYIKERVLSGEYEEGARITESKIAEELQISRAPVREGIRELQAQGLIKFLPRKGNYVAKVTMEDIKEIFDIRLLLENSVLEILISEKKLTQNDFEHLTSIVEDMVRTSDENIELTEKIIKINDKDIAFHKYLWEKSESRRRVKILLDLYFQLQMAMVIDTKLTGDLEITAKDHYDIIEFLKKGDLESTKKALRDHIISYRRGTFDRKDK